MSAVEQISNQPWLLENKDLFIQYGANIFSALLILLIGHWVINFVTRSTVKLLEVKKVDRAIVNFLSSLVRYAVLTMVVVAALGALGIDMSSLVAVLASASLAVSLALKKSLSNFASGILIVIFRPFKTKDFIEAGGASGSVQSIQIFHTVLNTGDNKMVVVPNSKIMSGPIINTGRHLTRRVEMPIRLPYSADIHQAKTIIAEVLAKDERILKVPAPTIAVNELASSSVNLVVRPWVKSADFWKVHFDNTQAIKEALEQSGIHIAYKQTSVHVQC
ncbi:MAG: mechanosensitive ion channel family protein [Vibrio sp.]